MRCSGLAVFALASALALGLAACGAAATPAPTTRWENQAWTLLVPDDLDLRPLNSDPRLVWVMARIPFFPASSTKRGFSIDAERQACSTADSIGVANKILALVAPSAAMTATSRRIGANDVAIGTTTRQFSSAATTLTVAVLCGPERLVSLSAAGITEPDVERILAGFTFREPASTEIDPPSAGP